MQRGQTSAVMIGIGFITTVVGLFLFVEANSIGLLNAGYTSLSISLLAMVTVGVIALILN